MDILDQQVLGILAQLALMDILDQQVLGIQAQLALMDILDQQVLGIQVAQVSGILDQQVLGIQVAQVSGILDQQVLGIQVVLAPMDTPEVKAQPVVLVALLLNILTVVIYRAVLTLSQEKLNLIQLHFLGLLQSYILISLIASVILFTHSYKPLMILRPK